MNNEKEAKMQRIRNEIRVQKEMFDREKTKRTIYTCIALAVVFYFLASQSGEMNSITDYILGVPVAIFGAGLYLYINLLIFAPILNVSTREEEVINQLRLELNALEKEQE